MVKSKAVEWGSEMWFLSLCFVLWKMGKSEGEVMVIPRLAISREGRGHQLELRSEQEESCGTLGSSRALLFGGVFRRGGLGQVSGTRPHRPRG